MDKSMLMTFHTVVVYNLWM